MSVRFAPPHPVLRTTFSPLGRRGNAPSCRGGRTDRRVFLRIAVAPDATVKGGFLRVRVVGLPGGEGCALVVTMRAGPAEDAVDEAEPGAQQRCGLLVHRPWAWVLARDEAGGECVGERQQIATQGGLGMDEAARQVFGCCDRPLSRGGGAAAGLAAPALATVAVQGDAMLGGHVAHEAQVQRFDDGTPFGV